MSYSVCLMKKSFYASLTAALCAGPCLRRGVKQSICAERRKRWYNSEREYAHQNVSV